jgi:phenylpropionate dioxygenase-like ring-hydroxylating dioxygenase large terminal subunit
MYVRNCWYVAAWDYDLAAGAVISRMILNEQVVLYRSGSGIPVAMEDRCCHRSAPLSKGRVEGDDIRCMYHGLKFNRLGICNEIPGQTAIPQLARVKTYPVAEKHSWLWVWMGDAAAADEALIPPAVGLDNEKWTQRSGQLDYEANYQLLNDNLTDLTHLSFLHANSFGAPAEFALTRPNIDKLDRGLRFWRWIDTPSRPPLEGSGSAVSIQEVDSWQTYDYLAPGVLIMYSAVFPKGTADRFRRKAPNDSVQPLVERVSSQAVTPMTDRTTRYYFSTGTPAGEGADARAAQQLQIAGMAFTEDKEMIEAQQKVIDREPHRRELLIGADLGPAQMRAVIDRLAAREKQVPTPTSATSQGSQ